MLNIDLRSFLIGGLCTALFFLISGFQKDANLGDIVVNSITILDDGHGGFITAYNEDQKRTLPWNRKRKEWLCSNLQPI